MVSYSVFIKSTAHLKLIVQVLPTTTIIKPGLCHVPRTVFLSYVQIIHNSTKYLHLVLRTVKQH